MPGGTAISIQNVSKRYQIGVLRHDTLRDQIAHSFQRLFSRRRSQDNAGNNSSGILWALREVAFDVYHGEVVGLIGRNGAGKSTLLKILAHITEPTTGRVELYGRIGSLLEVGTGFHPELSGRENIYMNGAILGMSRKEIEVKFDQILDFAEIHKFIDTPVKRYSSGMYVRLAFAVAAHLEPEILLVDEVLAVGDAAFQRKCLGKMSDIASEGRTVVFVSHNMSAIQTLCRRGIFLNEGRVAMDGEIDQVAAYYLSTLEQFAAVDLTERSDRSGRGLIRLLDVKISSPGEWDSNTLATGRPAQFTFFVTEARPGLACTFTIFDYKGTPICNFRSALSGPGDLVTSEIGNAVVCTIDELLLLPGQYRINVGLRSNDVLEDRVEAAAYFIVEQGQLHGRPAPLDNKFGSAIMPHHWQLPA